MRREFQAFPTARSVDLTLITTKQYTCIPNETLGTLSNQSRRFPSLVAAWPRTLVHKSTTYVCRSQLHYLEKVSSFSSGLCTPPTLPFPLRSPVLCCFSQFPLLLTAQHSLLWCLCNICQQVTRLPLISIRERQATEH